MFVHQLVPRKDTWYQNESECMSTQREAVLNVNFFHPPAEVTWARDEARDTAADTAVCVFQKGGS